MRKNGKAAEGVDIYMGGKVGKDAKLGTCVQKGVPCDELPEVLTALLTEHFGAEPQSDFSAHKNGDVEVTVSE